jgi:phospholipid/cholesterol/gamma-HCH transport system permease protein
MLSQIGHIGGWIRRLLEHVGNMAILLLLTLRGALRIRPHQLGIISRRTEMQILFTALHARDLVLGSAFLIGGVVMIQAFSQLSAVGGEDIVGQLMVMVVVRELGPLLVAVLIIGRSTSAIAAHLGQMRLGGEVDSLEVMGVDLYRYLMVPRLVGGILSVFSLVVIFDTTAIVGGFLVTYLKFGLSFATFLETVRASLSNVDIAVTVIKSLAFGITVPVVASYFGLSVSRSPTELPQAVTNAVVTCFILVFLLDGLLTAVFYL